MAGQYHNLQDHFLNIARKEKIEINIFLVNGVPIKGRVLSFDNFTILIDMRSRRSYRPVPYRIKMKKKNNVFGITGL